MGGILAIWNRNGLPIDAAAFDRSLAQMVHRGPDGVTALVRGQAGLGCCLSRITPESSAESQPVTFGELVGVFEGRIDNRKDLAAAIGEHPLCPRDCPDSHLAIAAFSRFGDRFAAKLEGDFAVAIFNTKEQRLVFARDRVGIRPLCYARWGETFIVATDAKAILSWPGATRAPDDQMLAEFILYFPSAEAQNRTFFKGVSSLPPAHFAVLDSQTLRVERYFEFDTRAALRLSGFDEYAEAFGNLVKRSVRRRLRSRHPIAISVSGGLDSSYIFCLADRFRSDHPGLCGELLGLNYGGGPGTSSDESEFVAALKDACKAPIEHLGAVRGFVATAADDAWHSESPDIEGLGAMQDSLLQRAQSRGARLILTGHWGDQLLLSWDYLIDLLYQGEWRLFRDHRRGWQIGWLTLAAALLRDQLERRAPEPALAAVHGIRGHFDQRLRAPWFTARFRRLLADRFAAPRLSHPKGSAHAWSTYQQCRLSYQVHCMEWNARIGARRQLEYAFPFLDRDLVQFLVSIPGDVQAFEGMPRNLMRQAMRGTVPDKIVGRRTKGVFTHLGNESVERDFHEIEALLGKESLAVEMGYLDGDVLAGAVAQWRVTNQASTDSIAAWRIVDLCGIEVFLREFFGNSPKAHERNDGMRAVQQAIG